MVQKLKKDSIAHKMISEVPTARANEKISAVMRRLSIESKLLKNIDYIYVLNKHEKLIGVVSIRELFAHSKSVELEKVMNRNIISVSPDTDQEKVAHLALKHNIKSVPVVKRGRLLGVVPSNKLISILNRSLQEDILHFAGIHKSHLEYENTMEIPLFMTIWHRIPWLIIGLLGIIFTAAFINIFEATLEKYLILAFFIPAIVYMSDALGTQHQTLFIRDLAILGKELKLKQYYLRQITIGLFLALLIAVLVYAIVSLFWKQYYIAFVIAVSMFIALLITSITSLLITSLINKLGQDPALGSGPFATIISDFTSIVIYFLIASLLL